MGAWGTDNFERDDALNVLDWWYEKIIDDIKKTFDRDNQTTLFEDYGESRIVANLDILITLVERYQSLPNIQLQQITQWKQDYLQAFDRTIENYLSVEGFVEERRKIVEGTFDKLYTLVQQILED
jgi:hypothetical protein